MGQIGNDVEYDELRRQHRDALRTIAEQSARIAALEAALAAAREELEQARGCLECSDHWEHEQAENQTMRHIDQGLHRSELSALRARADTQTVALPFGESAEMPLRARARDEGRVERVAKWMRLEEFGEGWEELDDGEQEAWRRKARAVLAAADRMEP